MTEGNAMPNFSEVLRTQLRQNIIDRAQLNKEVIGHLQEISKDLYLNTQEWHAVCSQLIKEYPVLADTDNPLSYVSHPTAQFKF